MIAEIRLKNFRSYTNDSFEFGDGVNIIVGPNASGKTNLLEAILIVTKGSSYRVKDSDLVQFNKTWSRLDSRLADGTPRTVKITPNEPRTKTYNIDGKDFSRLSLNTSLPVVLFEPNHLELLAGGPEQRRNYIDDLLEQTVLGFGKLRKDYKRTLAQRNALLKKPQTGIKNQIFAWDVRLSELGGQIVRHRTELVNELQKNIPRLYKELSKTKTNLDLRYDSSWPSDNYQSHLLKKLASSLETDIVRGFTGNGPHREDLIICFDGHLAQDAASRGESRTAVLAMKITELKIIERARNITPILLLDDVFSELDGARRRSLTEHLSNYQTFITTTDADIVVKHFTATCQIIALGN